MLSNRTWPGWIARTTGSVAVWLGSGAVGYSQAAASAPRPPEPGVPEVLSWALSGSSPVALVAAVASALGFVASVYQLFGPKPYSAEQGREDRKHQNESFAAADGRQQSRHETSMDALTEVAEITRRDKHAQAMADLAAGTASPELVATYRQILAAAGVSGQPVSASVVCKPLHQRHRRHR